MYSLIGIIIGVLSSMFGFGGGFVVVPILFAFLPDSIPGEYLMHTAIGTSLAVMIINSFNSTYNHAKKGNVTWSVFKILVGYIAIGSLIGGVLAVYIKSDFLRFAFIGLLVYVLIANIFKKSFTVEMEEHSFRLPKQSSASFIGIGIGFLSTLLGIGGSTMTIPYLRNRGMRMIHAVALATPLGLPVAIVGAFTYLITGMQIDVMPSSTVGFIYLPALIGFTIGGFIGVPIGRSWAQKLSDKLFSKIYLILLFIVIIMMVIS
ncbi:sulfite exporter TauE/SafE family protein [Lentibacillus daqui]|nr:sulfite exporter TauE/SafE family protein [Lentibacillus daqui]